MGFRDIVIELKEQLHLLLQELAGPWLDKSTVRGWRPSPQSPWELVTCGLIPAFSVRPSEVSRQLDQRGPF